MAASPYDFLTAIKHEINDPASSSLQPCATKETNSYGPSLPMQPMVEPQSIEKQSTQASCVIGKVSNFPQTWRESLSLNPSQDTRGNTSPNTSWQQQHSTTGAITNKTRTDAQPKRSKHGNQHVTSSPKTPSSPQDGTSLLFTPCTPTSVWQECKISSPPPKLHNPKKVASGKSNSSTEMKCSTHGKKPTSSLPLLNMSPSQNAYGFISTSSSMTEKKPTCGKISSQEQNLSKNGKKITKTPIGNENEKELNTTPPPNHSVPSQLPKKPPTVTKKKITIWK
jgi:hypothetical protein